MPCRSAAVFLCAVLCPVGFNSSLIPTPLCPVPGVADYLANSPLLRIMPQNSTGEQAE